MFLDRDGTIIEHVHHLSRKEDVRLIPGAADAIERLRIVGYAIVVVTNQSVVGRGKITEVELDEIHKTMCDQLEAAGTSVDGIYWCSHVPATKDLTAIEHPDRKPGTGMFERAAKELDLDVAGSWMIGDSLSDTQAGRNAGCRGTFLVRTGFGEKSDRDHDSIDFVSMDLPEAAARIAQISDVPVEKSDPWDWWPVPSADQAAPFFIVGAERSGTTLFRLLLSAHPAIACHAEFEYVVDCLDPETGTISITDFRDRIVRHRKFPELFKVRNELTSEPQIDIDHPALVRAFLEQFRREQGRPIIGATVHYNYDRLLDIWPNARFLHILRDPRDVARSHVKMGWSGTPYQGIEQWIEAEQLWEKLSERLGSDRYVDIQYETLIASPVEELTRICEFLGVEYSDAMLEYHAKSTYGPLDPTMTWQWQGKMTATDAGLVEGRIGDMLTTRGYEPSGEPSVVPSAIGRTRLAVVGRLNKWKWRLRRYGFKLMATHFAAKTLGMSDTRDRARRAMQDIDNSKLR